MITWWHHQMETFSALLALCAGNSPITGEFPSQRPVMRSFDVFFDLCLNKQLSKQSWGWWLDTPSRSSWHHCNDFPSGWRRGLPITGTCLWLDWSMAVWHSLGSPWSTEPYRTPRSTSRLWLMWKSMWNRAMCMRSKWSISYWIVDLVNKPIWH